MKSQTKDLKEDKELKFELKSIFPNKEVEMQVFNILYGKGNGKKILGEERPLTLKRELTKD